MPVLEIEIDCSEATCSSRKGKFCRFVRNRRFGTVWFCQLWNDLGHDGLPKQMDTSEGGFLLRRPECLKTCSGQKIKVESSPMPGTSTEEDKNLAHHYGALLNRLAGELLLPGSPTFEECVNRAIRIIRWFRGRP